MPTTPYTPRSTRMDLVGHRYGRLVVQAFSHAKGYESMWVVLCDCGRLRVVQGGNMRSGATRSCGCARASRKPKHGHTGSPTYITWSSMKARCSNPNHPRWDYYGGRGITVCERWRASFAAFLADMGERPDGLTIDRIDNAGHYEPGNCRWATKTEQNMNRRPMGSAKTSEVAR